MRAGTEPPCGRGVGRFFFLNIHVIIYIFFKKIKIYIYTKKKFLNFVPLKTF
jgi:hypothetical protein